jgi:hypothetical protein
VTDEPLPANVPLTLYRGDTRVWTDTIERNTGTDEAPMWVPYDLTGHTFLAQVRATKDRTSALKATIAVVATDAVNGVVGFTLTSAEADGLDVNPCYWDFQITRTSDSFRRTHLAGKVKVLGDVSNV